MKPYNSGLDPGELGEVGEGIGLPSPSFASGIAASSAILSPEEEERSISVMRGKLPAEAPIGSEGWWSLGESNP